ncbi:hypothetical protein AVEN_2942-1 [Araneus ventricosus]|uniref:THAP-type domain-containing protein n=1 Tax=Araneus ventricosus TaxID=182803 RepID=A0A4Y2ILD6_ARAVE|nr:hypothetical protein AVEN_2942-1 [Araneus ventricosus]
MGSAMKDKYKLMVNPNASKSRITCSAYGCNMRSGTNAFSIIKMYRFPKDPIRRRMWEIAVRRTNWKASSGSRLCSKHFISGKPSSDPKDPDYVPSKFVFSEDEKDSGSSFSLIKKPRKCRKSSDEPAALKDINDPDWAPSLFLGHNYFQPGKHAKGKSGNEIEDLLYDPSKGRKWHPLLKQKKYYEETHSGEVIDIIEWRSSLEKKRLKALNIDSEDTNESSKDGKQYDSSSPVTIIYLRGERS